MVLGLHSTHHMVAGAGFHCVRSVCFCCILCSGFMDSCIGSVFCCLIRVSSPHLDHAGANIITGRLFTETSHANNDLIAQDLIMDLSHLAVALKLQRYLERLRHLNRPRLRFLSLRQLLASGPTPILRSSIDYSLF